MGVFFSKILINEIGCNKYNSLKWLDMVIFKLLFLSYMPTTFFSFYHTNSITMLYLVQKYKKKFESTKYGFDKFINSDIC